MHNPPRILSIEDESTVRKSIVAYLADSGYEVIEAEDGRVGLQRILADEPDLILCDLRMPEVDGLKVLDEVNRLMPDIPFIVVSGTGQISDAIEALRLGAWDYLMKPIEDMEVLELAVKRALDHARLVAQNHEYRESLIATNKELRQSLQKLEEDETAARHIQFQLFPRQSVTINGFAFDYFLRTSAFLSGDFLDYFRIDDARTGFYMADVSGHGASSAFMTVLLKSTLSHLLDEYREFGTDTVLHPEAVLKLLNETITARRFDKYLTMIYAVLDTARGVLRYCNGGQFPYPILREDGVARFLTEHHVPVGLFEDTTYRADELPLAGSFALAMFSDGVLEIMPEDRLLDKEGYLLAQIENRDPSIETLKEQMALDRPVQVPDDITILLVKKGGCT